MIRTRSAVSKQYLSFHLSKKKHPFKNVKAPQPAIAASTTQYRIHSFKHHHPKEEREDYDQSDSLRYHQRKRA